MSGLLVVLFVVLPFLASRLVRWMFRRRRPPVTVTQADVDRALRLWGEDPAERKAREEAQANLRVMAAASWMSLLGRLSGR